MSGTLERFGGINSNTFKETMIKHLTQRIGKGLCDAKSFMGNAYHQGSKFLGSVDRYAGMARKVIGAVAPVAGALTGPTGAAVGAAVSMGMKGLSMYDSLKTEAMGQANQAMQVGLAAKRGLK